MTHPARSRAPETILRYAINEALRQPPETDAELVVTALSQRFSLKAD